jgi:acyl-CoA thioester hydrolase
MQEQLVPRPAFVHHLDIRYGECDQQSVVFNANYLAYADDALDHWLRDQGQATGSQEWDLMVKSAQLVWHGSARWPDRLSIACGVTRWGRTSFDVIYRMSVDGRVVTDARLVYVSIATGSASPVQLPPDAVARFGEVVEVPEPAPGP